MGCHTSRAASAVELPKPVLEKPTNPPLQSLPKPEIKEKVSDLDTNLGVLMAVSRLQRRARRNKALKVARAEQQWKMFADLDTQDEAEMLHLAVFMQTLIDSVPSHDALGGNQTMKNALAEEEEDFSVIRLHSIELTEKTHYTSTEKNDEYDITTNKIDSNVVSEIVECYRAGKKVSRKAIVKILRRAYKMLQKMDNVTRMEIPEGSKLTVVGDLHGQLTDLLYILDEAGLPSATNKFIFNGDFVDRGEKGLEIVVILFALFVSEGSDVVCLNRGNHEDLPVCRVYGFESEVKSKYDELLFEMFAEVFNYIPLFALVNQSVFVVHGGLFHTPHVSLAELNEITRSDYYVKPPVPYPQNVKGLSPENARKEYLKQLQRDALWSDPTDEPGCYLNPRGAGVSFGPDIAEAFMQHNGIDMVVRSHECVFRGFDLPYAGINTHGAAAEDITRSGAMMLRSLSSSNSTYFKGNFNFNHTEEDDQDNGHHNHENNNDDNNNGIIDNGPLLCTLFSASNYIGGDNEGAFLMFLAHKFTDSHEVGGNSNLHYAVKRYKTSQSDAGTIVTNNHISLRELILKRKGQLASNFEAADADNSGRVSRVVWADIMQRVTMIKVRWLSIITSIAPPECLSPTSVDYRLFLASFTFVKAAQGSSSNSDDQQPVCSEARALVMDDMYGQRRKLETVFYFFDSDGDGMISLDEFREGCRLLNANLHPDYQLTNIEHTLKMMDFDGSGTIDINEFFETFRILDGKDGKVDGVISLAANRGPTSAAAGPSAMTRTISPRAKDALN